MRFVSQLWVLVVVLYGCAGLAVQPQVLTLNYTVVELADVGAARAVVERLRQGQTTIEGLLGSGGTCNFTADFSNQSSSGRSVNGTPGQPGFNVRLTVAAAANLTTTNPGTCPVVRDVAVSIGSTDPLALGQVTSRSDGAVTFADGRAFTTAGYAEARIDAFDSATRYASGNFRYAQQLAPDSPQVLFVVGSFAVRP